MKVCLYDLIRENGKAALSLNKKLNYNKDTMASYEDMIYFMKKELHMNTLLNEHMYLLALDNHLVPLCVCLLSVGDNYNTVFNKRAIGQSLLLSSADQFVIFHNHSNGNSIFSMQDKIVTWDIEKIAKLLNIKFLRHYVISNTGVSYMEGSNE